MQTPKTRREREIWQACDALVAEGTLGNRVTGDAIRDRLLELGNSKGSPNEIYKYRKTWREARGIEEEDFSQPVQGQITLADPIARAVESVRNEIRNEAQVEIERTKRDADEQIKALQLRIYGVEEELKVALENIQELTLENSELKSDCRQLQLQLSEDKQQKAVFEQRAKSSEAAYDKLENETTRILNELKQSHYESQDNIKKQLLDTELFSRKALEELKSQLETQQRQWYLEADRLKAVNNELDISLGKMESKLDHENQKNHELSSIIKTQETKIESLKLERKDNLEKIKELEHKVTILDSEVKQIKNQQIITHELHLELQHNYQNKLLHIAKLDERNRQLQAIIKEKFFIEQG